MFVLRDPRQQISQVLASELPFERSGMDFVMRLKTEQTRFKLLQRLKLVGGEQLALDHREVDLDLVEPAGVDRRVDGDGVGIPLGQALVAGRAAMRGAVVTDPEYASGRTVGFLAHDLVDQPVETVDARGRLAATEDLGAVHVPGGYVSQCAAALVLEFHSAGASRLGGLARVNPSTHLNAGLLVGAQYVIFLVQRLALPLSVVQIENWTRSLAEIRISRKNPAAEGPGTDGVGAEPAPDRRAANGSNQAATLGLSGNVGAAESRERQSTLLGRLAGQCLNIDDDLRGENRAVARAVVDPRYRPDVPRRNVCAISRRSDAADPIVLRSLCSACLGQRGVRLLPARHRNTVTYTGGRLAAGGVLHRWKGQLEMGYYVAWFTPPSAKKSNRCIRGWTRIIRQRIYE